MQTCKIIFQEKFTVQFSLIAFNCYQNHQIFPKPCRPLYVNVSEVGLGRIDIRQDIQVIISSLENNLRISYFSLKMIKV